MNDFINRYRIKHIRLNRDYDRIEYDRFYGYNSSSYFQTNREEIIEMEIPRHAFEELVDVDRKIHGWVQEERDEEYLRRQYPALKDAYDKYQMLLELYR